MDAPDDVTRPLQDPGGQLERAFINEYLAARGYDRTIDAMPPELRARILSEASSYAAGKLTEIEARAHFVHDLHGRE